MHLALLSAIGLVAGCVSLPKRDPDIQYDWSASLPGGRSEAPTLSSVYLEKPRGPGAPTGAVLLETGEEALLLRLHLARAAKESIDIQTFIWRDDPVSRAFFLELLEAARRGVRVRILVDGLNPMGEPEILRAMASAHANLEISLFRPLSKAILPSRLTWVRSILFRPRRVNRRMHNKLMLVDGHAGLIGGRNVQDKYYDLNPDMIFKDRDLLLTGAVTLPMRDMFETFWHHEDSIPLPAFEEIRKGPAASPARLREGAADLSRLLERASVRDPSLLHPSLAWQPLDAADFHWDSPLKLDRRRPRGDTGTGKDMFNALLEAREEIFLQTPYLVYRPRSPAEIRDMRRRNPGITFHVSTNSLAAADHLHVYANSFKYRQVFHRKLGLEIHEFRPHPKDEALFAPGRPPGTRPRLVIHAKTWVVDRTTSSIGSHNFDPRSTHFNTECGVVLRDPAFSLRILDHLARDTAPGNSWIVAPRAIPPSLWERTRRLIGDISHHIPFFDALPYRYTSNFDLREGGTPLPSRHPDFLENHIDVGSFPEVSDRGGVFKARFLQIFGGWMRPLL